MWKRSWVSTTFSTVIHVQYVRRLTYLNEPGSIYGDTHRWGIRFMFRATF